MKKIILIFFILNLCLCKSIEVKSKIEKPQDFTEYINEMKNYMEENKDENPKNLSLLDNLEKCNSYSKKIYSEYENILIENENLKLSSEKLIKENKNLSEYKFKFFGLIGILFLVVLFFIFKDFLIGLIKSKLP